MTQYPESGIKLVADTAEYNAKMDWAITQAEWFDQLGDLSISVSADVDTASFDIADMPLSDETFTVTIDADTDSIATDIESAVPDSEPVSIDADTSSIDTDIASAVPDSESVGIDAKTDTVKPDIEAAIPDSEKVDVKADVTQTDQSKSVLDSLNTIKNLKVLETVWNITGTAVDIFKQVGSFVAAPLLELDSAIAQVNAQTGGTIRDVGGIIKGVFYDDLGTSINQVAQIVTKAQQLKLPVEEATRAALEFTHTFTDQNPETVLDTINQMLINHLAPNATQAGNMLVKAFQGGANKGNDLLNAINNNATAINGLGLTGPQALSFIKTGMDNGFKSANDVFGALEKIKQNVTNAAGNQSSDVTKTLNILEIANPAETGEAWSADFFKKVIEGIKNQPGLSDTEKEVLFTNLIGGKQGGRTFAAFMKMSPDDADFALSELQGASQRAASEMDNSLSGAIADFELKVQQVATDFLSSEQIDLPGKIAALKIGLQDGLDTLAKGGTLSDALTIALKPIGLDETFRSLEGAMGDFIIGILQAVAMLQENPLIGNNAAAAKGTRATVEHLSEQQLTYKLKIDNPDDVAADIATAVSRGVTPDNITKAVGQAVNELVATGSDEAIKKAQALLDTLQKPIDQNKLPTIGMTGTPMNVEPVVTPEAVSALQQTINDAMLKNSPAPAVKQDITDVNEALSGFQKTTGMTVTVSDKATTSVDATNTSMATLGTTTETTGTQATNATQPITDVGAQTQTYGNNARDAAPNVQNVADATDDLSNNASSAAAPVGDAAGSMAVMTDSGLKLAAALDAANTKMGILIATSEKLAGANAAVAQKQSELDNQSTGGSDTPTKKHALGTRDATGTFMAGEAGREVITTNQNLAVLNNKTTEAIMAALQGYIPGGSFTRGGSTNIINNTNYIPNEAVADRLGFSQAATLRGQ